MLPPEKYLFVFSGNGKAASSDRDSKRCRERDLSADKDCPEHYSDNVRDCPGGGKRDCPDDLEPGCTDGRHDGTGLHYGDRKMHGRRGYSGCGILFQKAEQDHTRERDFLECPLASSKSHLTMPRSILEKNPDPFNFAVSFEPSQEIRNFCWFTITMLNSKFRHWHCTYRHFSYRMAFVKIKEA